MKSFVRKIVRKVRYCGSARSCPICKESSSLFLPAGVVPRNDARCPNCGSIERHRLLWVYLEREINFLTSPPSTALHVAPEPILEKKLRSLIGKGYLTADLFAQNVDVKMDITEIQFPENSFDFIYCSHVLEHVNSDRKALSEFQRVLNPGGMAILLVPITAAKTIEDPSVTDPAERLRLFGQDDHVRKYGPDYKERLIEAGFEVEVVGRGDFLNQDEIVKMGIGVAAGELFICRKR